MKSSICGIIMIVFCLPAIGQKLIKVEEAKDMVGDTVKICTKVLEVKYEETTKGSPTYIYTSQDNTNASVSFVIWGEKRKFFDYKPEKDLKDRDVCVTGKLELIKDKPVIIIEKQSQIDIR